MAVKPLPLVLVKIKSDKFYIIEIAGCEVVGIKLVYEDIVGGNSEQISRLGNDCV